MKKSKTVIRHYEALQLRKRERGKSTTFFLCFTRDGKRVFETLKTVPTWNKAALRSTQEECEAIARKRNEELLTGLAGAEYIAVKNHSFLDFAELVWRSKRTPDPYRKAFLKVKTYLKTLGKRDLIFGELSPSFAIGFRDYLVSLAEKEKTLSLATAAKYFEKFKHVIQEALRRELLVKNPCLNAKRIPSNSSERAFLTVAEIETLLKTPLPKTRRYDERLYADYFLFICLTGMRPTDARELEWQNIRGDYVAFAPSKTRTSSGKLLVVPLHALALEILDRRRAAQAARWSVGKKIFEGLPPKSSPNSVNAFLKNWLKAANIDKPITLYNGRHSFASNLILSGAGVVQVSQLLGHASLKYTSVYTHLTTDAKREAVALMRINAPTKLKA